MFGGKGTGGLCQWFQWGTVDDKVGEDDERYARESSPQPGRRLIEGKVTSHRVTGHKETGCKETGMKEMGGKTTGAKERGVGKETGGKETKVKAMGVRETGGKATGTQFSQEMGGKGDRLIGERENDKSAR